MRKGGPVKHKVVPLMAIGRFALPVRPNRGAYVPKRGKPGNRLIRLCSFSGLVRRLRQNIIKKHIGEGLPSAPVKNGADFPHCPLKWLRPCNIGWTNGCTRPAT